MGSSGKKRTTMAKLNRESKLREKRAENQARKAERRLTAGRYAADGATSPDKPVSSPVLDARPADGAER